MQWSIKRFNLFFLIAIIVLYAVLAFISLNNCYFWDVIQQVSKEGQWFYKTNFSSLLIPENNDLNIFATGYHPPLMGIMTAVLWKVFGYKLWVSHAFTVFWGIMLLYNTWKLITHLFPKKHIGWVFCILLLEPTVLTQFVIASPDFILFTALVISIRAIVEKKTALLAIGIFFLCGINMRGVFAGIILFFTHVYFEYLQSENKYNLNSFGKTLLPYMPTILILLSYFIYYFIEKGWFFTDSVYADHYSLPATFKGIVLHLFSFILRSVEYGRIAIWILALYFILFLMRKKVKLSSTEKMLAFFVLTMNGLYLLFVFISQMPFSPRYFMSQFFVLTILVLSFAVKYLDTKKIKAAFIVILFFTITGHLWIYPEKIAQPWEATLLHFPYYDLRKECFEHIDNNNYEYNDISAGFCLHGNRGFIELANEGKIIGKTLDRKYFLYSNISNIEDEWVDELKNPELWSPVKRFSRWPVFITIYQRN